MSVINRKRELANAFNEYDEALKQLDAELVYADSYLDMDTLFADLLPLINKEEDFFEESDQVFLTGMQTFNRKASGNKVRFQNDRQKVRLIRIWLKYYYENLN